MQVKHGSKFENDPPFRSHLSEFIGQPSLRGLDAFGRGGMPGIREGKGSGQRERPRNLLFLQAGMKRLWREKKNCNTNRERRRRRRRNARDEKEHNAPSIRSFALCIGKNGEFPGRLVGRRRRSFPRFSSRHYDLAVGEITNKTRPIELLCLRIIRLFNVKA